MTDPRDWDEGARDADLRDDEADRPMRCEGGDGDCKRLDTFWYEDDPGAFLCPEHEQVAEPPGAAKAG